MSDIFHLVQAALERGEPFALGIISAIKGSSPQKQGAKAIFYEDGRIDGTLGGGCLEAEIQQRARQALITGAPAQFELLLDHDFGWDDGLICGGKVSGLILPNAPAHGDLWRRLAQRDRTVTWGVKKDFTIASGPTASEDWIYQEIVSPPCALWIAGAGHVAQAVAPLASRLDFQVTVLDDRPALANARFFPEGTQLRVDYWDKLLDAPFSIAPTFGLIVTRGHQHDALALRYWVGRPFIFLGMIGSSRKWRLISDQFIEERIATAEQLARVACPVGLDILAQSVDEIALSIMAEMVQQRASKVYGRSPKSCQPGSDASRRSGLPAPVTLREGESKNL